VFASSGSVSTFGLGGFGRGGDQGSRAGESGRGGCRMRQLYPCAGGGPGREDSGRVARVAWRRRDAWGEHALGRGVEVAAAVAGSGAGTRRGGRARWAGRDRESWAVGDGACGLVAGVGGVRVS
jgi:hypothetical protein